MRAEGRKSFYLVAVVAVCRMVGSQMAPNMRSIVPIGYPCDSMRVGVQDDDDDDDDDHEKECRKEPNCDGYEGQRYRTVNGSCNNVANPTWGSAGSSFTFMAAKNPVTEPGPNMRFNSTKTGNELPDVRKVSIAIHASNVEIGVKGPQISLLLMQFGQFLDHDFTLTPQVSPCKKVCGAGEGEPNDECCGYLDKDDVPRPDHCWPIRVAPDDPMYKSERTCLDFRRSQVSRCEDGEEPVQFNLDTHLVDGSNIYGSFDEGAETIRAFVNGEMRMNQFSTDTLPYEYDHCKKVENKRVRPIRWPRNYVAGDMRVNENPGLQVMHTLWVKEHNKLAKTLRTWFPSKTDEEIYQETRRYNVAQWQNIVYSEFLDLVLGKDVVSKFNLNVQQSSSYDPKLKPNIFNEFSTAAFRFGHSIIPKMISLFQLNKMDDEKAVHSNSLKLEDHFFNTDEMRQKKMVEMMMGMIRQKGETVDAKITSAVRDHLFKKPNASYGEDLASLNMQRGRDHSIGTYDTIRRACQLPDLNATFGPGSKPQELLSAHWDRFEELYDSPLDIELFPAGMAELPIPGGLVGPTFACVIGEQFRRLRMGDRYFFTHRNVDDRLKFCDKEISAIRRRSLRDVICDNIGKKMKKVTRNPFLVADPESNPLEVCDGDEHKLKIEDLCAFGGEDPAAATDTSGLPDGREVLLVAAGFDGESLLKKVELFSPDGGCNMELADLPSARYGMVAFTFQDSIYACGGKTESDGTTCFEYVPDKALGSWQKSVNMSLASPRFMAAIAKSPTSDVLFISGGVGDKHTGRSFEFLDRYTGEWRVGPLLTSYRMRHCLVVTGDLELIVIGGFSIGKKVETFNDIDNKWGVNRTTKYHDRHSCIIIPGQDDAEVLIVGRDRTPMIFNRITGKERKTRGALMTGRGFGATANVEGEVLVVGGGFNTNLVERYDPKTETFLPTPRRLLVGRSRFAHTTVPARWFTHLGCN